MDDAEGFPRLQIPEEVTNFLKEYFEKNVLSRAMEATRYGKITIFVDFWKTPGVYGKIRRRYLEAFFEEGEITRAYFFSG